jgi:hypothetical protein
LKSSDIENSVKEILEVKDVALNVALEVVKTDAVFEELDEE